MRDAALLATLDTYRRRLRLASLAIAVLVAAAAAGGLIVVMGAAGASDGARASGAAALVLVAVTLGWQWWRRWTTARVAAQIEMRSRSLDNLVITAEEILGGRARSPSPMIRDELFAAALDRLRRTSPSKVQPLAPALTVATLSLVAVFALLTVVPRSQSVMVSPEEPAMGTESLAAGDLRVTVIPPSYARRPNSTSVNPASIVLLESSRVRLEVIRPAGRVVLRDLDAVETPFSASGDAAVLEFTAAASRPLIVRQLNATGTASDRLLHVRVQHDTRPLVRIREPAKDLVFASGQGRVPVQIEARDDVGLVSLMLRYTRVSGSGETFTFEEGEWPIEIREQGTGEWTASAVLSLEELKLEDGDTLVYRAVARDARPGADPASSDTFLIEVGRLAGVASTGFALPDDRERQAISQQMLIIKTERLQADRPKLSNEAFLEQAQLLAVEQRMVKAEFVFMTGGEVQDEVEEATHAHELAEGRLENSGQSELLTAIREMSRAEARLNAADTQQALEFERAALKALQRAFDRRRYLLRTLPERARIDLSRRLTGELATAQSSALAGASAPADPVVRNAQAVLEQLGAPHPSTLSATELASRVLALDPDSETVQRAALALSSATDGESQSAARLAAQHAVLGILQRRLSDQGSQTIQRDTLRGRLTQELRRGGTP